MTVRVFQALEKNITAFSKAWKKHRFAFPMLGKRSEWLAVGAVGLSVFMMGCRSVDVAKSLPPTTPPAASPFKPYAVTPALATNLARYHMRAYTYETGSSTQSFVLYRPQRLRTADEKVPVVIFLHALGEAGTDLNRLFIIPGIFDLTSPEFQSKHPCFLLAPQLVSQDFDYWSWPYSPGQTTPVRVLLEVLDMLCSFGNPQVDLDRLYVVGLCSGGMGALDLVMKNPGTFAATVPISLGYWGESKDWTTANLIPCWFSTVQKYAEMPSNHAWREDFEKKFERWPDAYHFTVLDRYERPTWNSFMRRADVWEWLFAKTNASPLRNSLVTLPMNSVPLPACTAYSNVESQPLCGPEQAVDGSLQTKFIAARSCRDEYLEVDFESPINAGTIKAYTGYEHGAGPLCRVSVLEFSSDGDTFERVATFSNGIASASIEGKPLRAVRVTASKEYRENFSKGAWEGYDAPLVVREIALLPPLEDKMKAPLSK